MLITAVPEDMHQKELLWIVHCYCREYSHKALHSPLTAVSGSSMTLVDASGKVLQQASATQRLNHVCTGSSDEQSLEACHQGTGRLRFCKDIHMGASTQCLCSHPLSGRKRFPHFASVGLRHKPRQTCGTRYLQQDLTRQHAPALPSTSLPRGLCVQGPGGAPPEAPAGHQTTPAAPQTHSHDGQACNNTVQVMRSKQTISTDAVMG